LRWLRSLSRAARDAPIYLKIAGVGGVALTFVSLATLLASRFELSRAVRDSAESEGRTAAASLAMALEGPLLTRNLFDVERLLREAVQRSSTIRWAAVKGQNGIPIARFGDANAENMVAASALIGADLGKVQMGLSGLAMQRSGDRDGRIFGLALALGIVASLIAMSLLTWRLTQPVLALVEAAQRVRDGDLDVTAPANGGRDELGELTAAFNDMVAALRSGRDAVRAQEAERVRLLEQILRGQEAERARLARELHDGLGQELSAMLMALRCSERYPEGSHDLGRGLDQRLEAAIDETRRMALALRPAVLDDHGLANALERLAAEVTATARLAVNFERIGSAAAHRLSPEVEVALYRIAQEALTNVVRHADGSRASLVLIQRSESVRLVIEDDGRGFDLEAAARRDGGPGLGLSSMRERGRLLGGMVEIESASGNVITVRDYPVVECDSITVLNSTWKERQP